MPHLGGQVLHAPCLAGAALCVDAGVRVAVAPGRRGRVEGPRQHHPGRPVTETTHASANYHIARESGGRCTGLRWTSADGSSSWQFWCLQSIARSGLHWVGDLST